MARAPDRQAHWAALQMQAHGVARAETRSDPGRQSSIGTTQTYEAGLRGLAAWARDQRAGDLRSVSAAQVRDWLRHRAGHVAQATLDRDRQAAQAWLSYRDGERVVIERSEHRSEVEGRGLAGESRVYTREQVDRVQARLAAHNALAVQVAREAGLRAQELATLARADERPATTGREWRDDRHAGRDGVAYTVAGKGGLVREVLISAETAARLEAHRQPAERVCDRGAHHVARYDIGYGRAVSQAWSDASRAELGWSAGLHALRHTYAQQRMHEIGERGYTYDDRRAIVAQELGHFRPETTEAYLR